MKEALTFRKNCLVKKETPLDVRVQVLSRPRARGRENSGEKRERLRLGGKSDLEKTPLQVFVGGEEDFVTETDGKQALRLRLGNDGRRSLKYAVV